MIDRLMCGKKSMSLPTFHLVVSRFLLRRARDEVEHEGHGPDASNGPAGLADRKVKTDVDALVESRHTVARWQYGHTWIATSS